MKKKPEKKMEKKLPASSKRPSLPFPSRRPARCLRSVALPLSAPNNHPDEP
jgi:hypothetical protein